MRSEMVKFSIIIPVFNIKQYLIECIESVLNQKYENYEIILVDDGSTDGSAELCDNYSKIYKSIKVIHKDNGGLSDARNTGLANAKGEYIVFIDGDDFIEKNTLKKFNETIIESNHPDIVITRIQKIYGEDQIVRLDEGMPFEVINSRNKECIINWMFKRSQSLWPSVRYIVKKELIDHHRIEFAVGYYHEDIDWTSRLFLFSQSYTADDHYWYNHRMNRVGSITSTPNVKRTLDIIRLVGKNIRSNEYNNLSYSTKKIIFGRLLDSMFASLSIYKKLNKEEKKMVLELVNENSDIYIYTNKFTHKLFVAFSKIFGFSLGLKILSLIHRT